MPLIKYHLYAHHKELNQDVCIMKTSKRKDLKMFFRIFLKGYHLEHLSKNDASNVKNMISDFKLQHNLIDFNINNYESFYFYNSSTKEIYDAVLTYDESLQKYNNLNYWILRIDNPDKNGSYSIIDKYERKISDTGKYYYKHFLSCPNPDCSWCENKDDYLVKINAELYKNFIRDVNDYYKSEENDYPDNPPYSDVSSIKECPQCHIPFNGKVQIKKEF